MESGAVFPKTQMEETLDLFKKIFEKMGKLKRIILLGDVKHYFAGVLRGEFEDFHNLKSSPITGKLEHNIVELESERKALGQKTV